MLNLKKFWLGRKLVIIMSCILYKIKVEVLYICKCICNTEQTVMKYYCICVRSMELVMILCHVFEMYMANGSRTDHCFHFGLRTHPKM
jgi:hypothetical protein